MTYPNDKIAPKTSEPHFVEPVKTENTTYRIERFTHRIPIDWFLIATGRIDAWHYEFFLENKSLFEDEVDRYSVKEVAFNYEREPVSDGTGKSFHIILNDSKGGEMKLYSRSHYLNWLLEYDEDSYEVVAMFPADDRNAILVTIQERLPHVPTEP